MAVIHSRPNEDIESLIRRFTLLCEKEGTLATYRKKMYYISPSQAKHENNCRLKHLQKVRKRMG